MSRLDEWEKTAQENNDLERSVRKPPGYISQSSRILTLITALRSALECLEKKNEALKHIASNQPRCEGCTLIDIPLVEHYTYLANDAVKLKPDLGELK